MLDLSFSGKVFVEDILQEHKEWPGYYVSEEDGRDLRKLSENQLKYRTSYIKFKFVCKNKAYYKPDYDYLYSVCPVSLIHERLKINEIEILEVVKVNEG